MEIRHNYPYFIGIPTRWIDNDIYGHVNNAIYYVYFDTVIAHFLMNEGGFDYENDNVVGFAIENQCQFKRPISYPEVVEAGLRIRKIGNSSVRYELGLFTAGFDEPAATGYFVHVFVDLANERRPVSVPPKIRRAMEKIVVK